MSYPETRVTHEDVVTREYWDGDAEEYVNTQESMLAIKMWLETTTAEQKRVAYDSMTLLGDIGGLYDFIVLVVTPLVGLIVGDRLSYYLLSKLYMINKARLNGNRSEPGAYSDGDDSDGGDMDAKKRRWKNWISDVVPYKTDCRTKTVNHNLVSILMCKYFRPGRVKQPAERVLELGEKKVARDLDIRSLIKA